MSIINPKTILEKGILKLPQHVDISRVLQPNGIDLSVESIHEVVDLFSPLLIGDEVKTLHLKAAEISLEPVQGVGEILLGDKQGYLLKKNRTYKIETGYSLHLPEDMVAYIFTRSSLNRNGILIGSGLWDSGYHGPVGTTIYPSHDLILVPPCRVAQIVFFKAESALLYCGSYNVEAMKNL